MAIATSHEFLNLLEKSRLLEPAEFDEARRLVDQQSDPRQAARQLIKKKLLSVWQAGQLLAGRSSFYLGKYKLIELLGRGGMGSVFLAEHSTMNRRVALKTISRHIAQNPRALKRFLTEARAIAALDHPNIVQAYSVDNEGDRYYLVMEYVDGPNLGQLVEREGPLDFARAADYIRQAAEGLAHAHQRHIIHCDIKPTNLLVNSQGVVKILDMGLARLVARGRVRAGLKHKPSHSDEKAGGTGGGETAEPAAKRETTESEAAEHEATKHEAERDEKLLGSVDYLAPEQALETPEFDHRADIYALGCTLYFLLTGRPPFPEGSIAERIMKHQTAEPEDIAALRPGVPDALARICRKMMAKKPGDRIQSAQQVAQVLGRWRPPAADSKPVRPVADDDAGGDSKPDSAEVPDDPAAAMIAAVRAGAGPGTKKEAAAPSDEPRADKRRTGKAPEPRAGKALGVKKPAAKSPPPRRKDQSAPTAKDGKAAAQTEDDSEEPIFSLKSDEEPDRTAKPEKKAKPDKTSPARKAPAEPKVASKKGKDRAEDDEKAAADEESPRPAKPGALAALLATKQGKTLAASVAIVLIGAVVAGGILLVSMLRSKPAPTAPVTAAATTAAAIQPAKTTGKPKRSDEPELDLESLPEVGPAPSTGPSTPAGTSQPEPSSEPATETKPPAVMPEDSPSSEQSAEQPAATESTEPPKTEPPKTEPPKTQPPKTQPPKTQPPKTQPPKKAEPLAGLLAAVDLPPIGPGATNASEPVPLGQVRLEGDAKLDVQLVCGQQSGKSKEQLALAPAADGGASWTIDAVGTDTSGNASRTALARLWLDGDALKLQWLEGIDPPRANGVRNCGLNVAAGGQTRFVALTLPKHVQPLILDLDRAPMRAAIPLDTAPSEESLRLEIVRLEGPFPNQEFKPGKVVSPKSRDPQSGKTLILLKQANTPDVGLEVGFLARGKSATIEVKPVFQFPNQPPVPFTGPSLMMVGQQIAATQKMLETRRDRARKEEDKNAATAGIEAAKAALDQMVGLTNLYQALNKTGKIHFRLFAQIGDKQIELCNTETPPDAAPPATTPAAEAEDLNLNGDSDGPKKFFQ